ncbi:MAG: ABC transporter ATP-binding protein [Desulfobacterales bacterium]|nr:ABC transporter ATP-binding protein [Desulfobacterales bacterium]MBF0396613.1 ABC transporter ATP-binding protein [Desulfobacterales bacterium]
MLKIKNLESGYGRSKALKKITMHVGRGEIVTIIGANGAGKTTLLNTISGLISAWSGEVIFDNQNSIGIAPEKMIFMGCALVPEGRQVFAAMTVKENLILGACVKYIKDKKYNSQKDIERIYEILPILKDRQNQLAGTLSGGEQQMLAIARAMMSNPKFIMMDEPSMGLAPLIVRDIFNIIKRLREEGTTILLVEQNAKMALGIADRGYVIETGRIIIQGLSDELLTNKDVQRAYLGRDLDSEIKI